MTKEEAAELLYKSGLLFEINRVILHPLGLALAVVVDDNDTAIDFLGIKDTDDQTGWIYSKEDIKDCSAKLDEYMKNKHDRLKTRSAELGYIVQPRPTT